MNEELKLEFESDTDAGPLDEDYIEDTEDMLNLEFTPEFITFLKNHNGGVPKKRYFRLGKNVKVVEQFLCIFSNYKEDEKFGQFDIGVVWSQIEDRLNEFLIPFAALFPGDFLCFDYENGEAPTVVLWIHDQSGEGEPATKPVADSFEQFLAMLTDNGENS